MTWVFCKQCKCWHRVYPTTVMRCPYCGADVTEWKSDEMGMINKRKVINEIEEEICLGEHWDEDYRTIDLQLLRDALTLLKEQESVEPILKQDSMVCGNCGHEVIWQRMIGDNVLADE